MAPSSRLHARGFLQRWGIQAALKEAGIPTAVHYPVPLHRQPVFACLDVNPEDFASCEKATERVVSLPMHPDLVEPDQVQVVDALISAMRQ